MARSEGGLCGFPIYRHTTTAPKTSECSSIVSMQYVWKIDVISIFSNTDTFKKFLFLKKPNTIHAIHQTLLPEYTILSTPAVWYLRFRSSGKLARFYSSPTHHWCYSSSQAAPGLQGHTTTWWSWEQNFQVDFLLQHNNDWFTSKLKLFQESTKSWLPNSNHHNAYCTLYITTSNIILTIITLALLIFQVRSNWARFRIGSNAVSHVAQSKSYVPLHI